jgi:hypothetical protein
MNAPLIPAEAAHGKRAANRQAPGTLRRLMSMRLMQLGDKIRVIWVLACTTRPQVKFTSAPSMLLAGMTHWRPHEVLTPMAGTVSRLHLPELSTTFPASM